MAVKTTATKSAKKDTKAPAKKAPTKTTTAKEAKPAAKTTAKPAAKASAKPAAKPVVQTSQKAAASTKTAYHVSKRDDNGREWKVFIQGSNKVIKLFNTQQEALNYAKSLCKNKDDGSYVLLHGLDGKMRKF